MLRLRSLSYLIITAFSLCLSITTLEAQEKRPFLQMKEKGRLMWRGEVVDEAGNRYNIRVLPGYVKPCQFAQKRFSKINGYMQDAWQDTKSTSNKLLDLSEDGLNFAFHKSGDAWKTNFASAERRMKKGSFGWWLSYPWATMKSSVETVVRVPLGSSYAGLTSGSSVTFSPAFHYSGACIKSSAETAAGTIFPLTAISWHTIMTPPLALMEKTPSPETVDPMWVEIIHRADAGLKTDPLRESLDVIGDIE